MKLDCNRQHSTALGRIRSTAIGGIRLLSIAIGLLCAGVACADISASPWAESAPPIRFESRGWAEGVLATNLQSIAIEGGRLQSNATWTNDVTHVVLNWVVVPSGVTLTISEGTIVKLCPSAGIKVEDGGTLRIFGAEGAEVVVTTADDESVGGSLGELVPPQSGTVDGIQVQSSEATFSDNTHVRFTFSSAVFPTLTVQDASAKRSDGIARIPVLVSGTARDTAFCVDWRAIDGSAKFGEDYLFASGSLRWSKSSDGTKHIEIPLDAAMIRGSNTTFRVELTTHYACNAAVATAEVVVREFDFPDLACSEWTGNTPVRFDGRDGLACAVAHGVELLGEPDGSTNRLWDTTALADGWQEIVAQSGETTSVLFVNSQSIAVEGGRLQSNASWDASATHLVRHSVVVPNGYTLTVGEDAVVKFLPGTYIKVEDGGTLSVIGAKGHDAIFTAANDATAGEVLPGIGPEQSGAFDGIRLQSSAATFTDNTYLQTHGFAVADYPYVQLNDTVAFRNGGMAYVPVSIASGTRNQAFSIDWVAVDGTATFGEDYTLASGTIEWTGTSQGTKTLQIPIVTSHVVGETTNFRLRIAVNRGCNPSGSGECTVTIRELNTLPLRASSGESSPVRFDTRESLGSRIVHGVETLGEPDGSAAMPWNTAALADGWHEIAAQSGETAMVLAVNSQSIAVEGGRLQSNASWTSDETHLVRHWVVVPSGKTLTVTEGAVVKICPDAGILVEDGGKLVVNGRDDADAIFTTVDDDTVGARLEAAAPQSGAVGCIRLQSSAATLQDNGWFQLRGVPCNASNIGQLSIHDAEVSRKAGVAYVAVTVAGNARNQSFSADWEAVPGTATFGRDYTLASGRVTWSKSGDGTKWIAVPLNKKTETDERRTFTVRLKAVRGMNGAGAEATVEIREYEEGALVGGEIAFFQTKDGSAPSFIDEPVWKAPMFLHDEKPICMSGAWQDVADPAATIARLSWESENCGGVLAEAPGEVPTIYTWRAEDWPVGSYTLRHDILDAESGRRLATYQKTFAVPTWENVELHGGTLTSNETWRAGTVHIVYETVFVPALYTILLEPGAIVKFLTGTGIVIEPGGGALFASGVVFTHINDDTVGGDTLNDGAMLAPVMDAYFFSGDLTLGDESELRCKTQTPLSGTISGSRKLTRGSTYRVSGNVTIASGATLTIPAGTILKFDEGVQMTVNSGGTLLSNGTRAAPVVFTSIKDDDFGGDTNGDGDATGPSAGDWATIKVAGGRAEFNNSKILYSSRNQTTGAINQSGGTVVFDGGEIAHGLYDAVGVESGNFFMTNAVIRDCLQAFRHWARDPIVNCVIYDCGRLTQGGGQTFVNCVFADIDDTWEAFGFPNSTYRNCVFWNEGGSVLTGEGTQDALTVCGQNGNVWGDPMFRDAEAGDYRIREGSACIDAADSSAAPDKDMFGQKRWDFPSIANADAGAADIGVSECIPRNAASDVDLVPVSVRMSWNRPSVKPGDVPYFFWSVANEGGEDVETDWWDELSLVSVASGRITVLGEYNQGKGVTPGGTTTGSQYFEIPPLTPGDYRLRLNANSHRNDVPEGSRTDNNVLVSETVVHVEVVTEETENGSSGMVSAGGRIVRAFDVAPGSGAMLVRVTAPAGAVVRYGLGVMPGEGTASGEIAVDASGQAVFAVPEGTESVYVVLESAEDGFYDIVFLDGALAVASVSPSQVPRSGSVTLRVAGAGFEDGCAVSLVAPSGAAVAPERLIRASAEELWATVDCAALAAVGNRFALRVETDAGEATLDNAVTVTGAEGRGSLWAEFDHSNLETTRRGARIMARIRYGNHGNVDVPAPILEVAADGGGELGYIDGRRGYSAIQFIGAGGSSVAGVLRPGEERTIKFQFWAGESGSIYLYTSEGQTWFEAPWTSLDAMLADFSAAATRIALRGQDATDYELVHNLALAVKRGDPTSAIYGRVVDQDGIGVEGVTVTIADTNQFATVMTESDANGFFLVSSLTVGRYEIDLSTVRIGDDLPVVKLDGNFDAIGIQIVVDASVRCHVSVSGIEEGGKVLLSARELDGSTTFAPVWTGGATAAFRGLPDGWYRIEAISGSKIAVAGVAIRDGVCADVELYLEEGGRISGDIPEFTTSAEMGVMLLSAQGFFWFCEPEDDGTWQSPLLPTGVYSAYPVGSDPEEYPPLDGIEVDRGESIAVEFLKVQSSSPSAALFSRLAAFGARGAGDSLWPWSYIGVRSDLDNAIARGNTLLSATYVSVPWEQCPHNLAKYKSDSETYDGFQSNLQRLEAFRRKLPEGYFMPIASNFTKSLLHLAATAERIASLKTPASAERDALVNEVINITETLGDDLISVWLDGREYSLLDATKSVFVPRLDNAIVAVWDAFGTPKTLLQEMNATGSLTPFTRRMDAAILAYDEAMKFKRILARTLLERGISLAALDKPFEFMDVGISYLKSVNYLLKGIQAWDDGYANWMDDNRRIAKALAWWEPIVSDFISASGSFNRYHSPCPDDVVDIPLFDDEVDSITPTIPQPGDPNEVIGPYGLGDPETERFVKPGEWLDFTIYFENVTNATASAREVNIREDLSPYLDWESLTLGEVVFANETDMGLVGTSGGTSEYAVPGTNYLVRTTFTHRNGLANWYLRLVDPDGDEDGWPLDEWLYTYGGFLPPNTTNHVGEGHVSYRIKVRDDAPKNVVIETSADIVFDCNESISTDPAWWNTIGHLPVALTFDRNCDDVVLDMPTNGSYKCDAPDFGTPSREGWLFLGWADTNGVARNCGADLPYDTAALDLYAQWREEVETKFATIAVDGGVLIAGLADGQACPVDLVIPATVEVGGRRVKVIGVADDAFKGKRAIQTLTVMEGVRTIGARSFMNCTSLASVSLPSTIESIGENAFYGCRLLSSVTIAAETPPTMGADAFRSVAASGTLRVPTDAADAYAAWPGSALGSAWTLEGFDPDEPVEPGEPAWTILPDQNLLLYAAGASDIRWAIEVDIAADGGLTLVQATGSTEPDEDFVLPDSVLDSEGNEYRIVAIGANADILDSGIFEGQEFGSVTIPEFVETIAPCAFANCAGLREFVFAGDSPALRELGEGAFFSCTSLAVLDLAPLSSLERIGPEDAILGVFESCWYLPEVTLPATVESIGAYAFQDCSRLRAVRAGGGDAALTAIGERAFYNCDSLESVEAGCLAALETMGDAAFGGDTAASAPKIARIALGTAIASLGADVFLNAAQLAEVTCLATNPPARDANAFRGMLRTGILHLPEESIEDYTNETARAWVGIGTGKLAPWNGSTGWQVKSGDAGGLLREMESHLTDEEFEAFLALATLLGFTEEELCEVDHPAEQLAPELRIVSFDPDAEYPLAIRFENGIDETPSAAFARLWSTSGDKIFVAVSDELGGVERRVPLQGIQGDSGLFRVNLGTALHRDEPAQFVRIVVQ